MGRHVAERKRISPFELRYYRRLLIAFYIKAKRRLKLNLTVWTKAIKEGGRNVRRTYSKKAG
jgi:hypothetical protein